MHQQGETLYQTLGVKRNATQKEIKQAYRAKALKYHPDKCTDHEQIESLKAFQNINNAFSVLSNESERNVYDKKLKYADQKREIINQINLVLEDSDSDSLSSTSSNEIMSCNDYDDERFNQRIKKYMQNKNYQQQKLEDQYNQYNASMNLNAKDQVLVDNWQAQYQLKQSQKQTEQKNIVQQITRIRVNTKVIKIKKKINKSNQKT